MPSHLFSRPFLTRLSRHAIWCAAALAPAIVASVCRADLYVADGDVVRRFNSNTGAVIQTNGNNTFTSLFSSTGITTGPDGLIYVANTNPGFNPNLEVITRYNANTGAQVGGAFVPFANGPSQLSNAQGLAFGGDGHLYVADLGDNGPVKSFDSTGAYVDTFNTQGGNAQAVAFNPNSPGNVYVATGSTIERINLTTHANDIIVQGSSSSFDDGPDLTFGPDGKLYVLDTGAHPRVFRYNADGTGQSVFVDFTAAPFFDITSHLFQPTDLAFGPNGDLYVSGTNAFAPTAQQGEIMEIASNGASFVDRVTNLDAPGFLTFANVPEPAALCLAGIGAAMLLRGRRRRV